MANNDPLGALTEEDLHNAAKEGDLLKVVDILKINPSLLNKPDRFGQTALIWAKAIIPDRSVQIKPSHLRTGGASC